MVARDSDGLSDSYVNVQLIRTTEEKEEVQKSEIIESLNPDWNFECARMYVKKSNKNKIIILFVLKFKKPSFSN